jgi:hypothetical protein
MDDGLQLVQRSSGAVVHVVIVSHAELLRGSLGVPGC